MGRSRAPKILLTPALLAVSLIAFSSWAQNKDVRDDRTYTSAVPCAGWNPDFIAAGAPREFVSLKVTSRMIEGKERAPELKAPYLLDFSSVASSQPLFPGVRLPAEWEPKEAILMDGRRERVRGLLEALETIRERPSIFLLHDPASLMGWDFQSLGFDAGALPIRVEKANSPDWPRDAAGLFVEHASDRGRVRCRLKSDATILEFPRVGSEMPGGCPVRFPGRLEGGFILSDGAGFCATTHVWMNEGAEGVSPLRRAELLRSYLGCSRVLVLTANEEDPSDPNDGDRTGHVDTIFKFVPGGGALVAYLDRTDRYHPRFNENFWFLRKLEGEGMFRDVSPFYLPSRALVPTGKEGECREFTGEPLRYPPLMNAYLLDEETVLVPQFRPTLVPYPPWSKEIWGAWNDWWEGINERSLRSFRSAGFSDVVPADATGFVMRNEKGLIKPQNFFGAFHCATNEVPALSR